MNKKIIFFLLLTFFVSRFTYSQIIGGTPQSVLSVDSVTSKTYTLNEVATDSTLLSVERGIRSILVDTISATSNITLQPNQEKLSNSNKWVTNLGSWQEVGNMDATRQSDSSVLLSNIPTELNPNPTFSDFSYSDIVVNGTVISGNNTGWSFSTGALNNGGVIALDATVGANPYAANTLSIAADLNSVYELTYTVLTTNAPANSFYLYGISGFSNAINTTTTAIPQTVGTHSVIVTANGTGARTDVVFRLLQTSGYNLIFDNISLKKLVAPTNWSSATIDGTHYLIKHTNGMRYVSGTTSPEFNAYTTSPILTIGKKYIIEVEITDWVSGSIKIQNITKNGSNYEIVCGNGNGIFKDTIVTNQTQIPFTRNSASVDLVISRYSVKEYFENSEFKLPTTTEPNKYYRLSIDSKKNIDVTTELNPNLNFTTTYTDKVSGWDFTNWSTVGGGTIVDNNSFTSTSSSSGIYKTALLTTSKANKIDISATTNYGIISAFNTSYTSWLGSGNGSYVFVPGFNGIILRNSYTGSSSTDVNSLSVYELVAPANWTSALMGATNYIYKNSNGLQFVEATGTTFIELSGLTANEHYRIIANIYSVTSGELNLFVDGSEYSFRNSAGLDTIDVFVKSTKIRLQVDNNSNLVLESLSIKKYIPINSINLKYGIVSDSTSLTNTYQTITKEFWGQGSDTIKISMSENSKSYIKNISLQEITSKQLVVKGDTAEVYFTPNTASVGNKTGKIYINNDSVLVSWVVEYPDSLLALDSTSFDFGTITENTKDLVIKVRNLSEVDTIDFHSWLNLTAPFSITSYNQGWYVNPQDSGLFTFRATHLGVDTVVTQNIGWVYSDVADNFRDTIYAEIIVTMQVNSNTLLAATNLTATTNNAGIYLSWTDPNVADTVAVHDLNFLTSADVALFTPNSANAILSYDVGKLKITNNNINSSWNSALLEISVISGQRYEIEADYIDGTALTGWLVAYNKLTPSTLLTNQSATNDTTFNYSFVSTFTGTLVIKLQININALAQYGHFDNFLVKQTEPSYEYLTIERQPYYLNFPNGDFVTLYTNYDAITSYLNDGLTEGDQYNYRIKYFKNSEYVTSNSDTATYTITEEESEVDMHNIYADAYVKNGGSTTWADRTDSATGITIETLLSNIATLGTNKIVAFKSGQYFLKSFKLNGSAYDGLKLTTYGGSERATIGLYDTLDGWSNSANWVSQGAVDGGYLWKYDFSGEFMEDYALQKLWLNDIEYYPRANLEKLRVLSTYYISLGTSVSSEGGQAPELIEDSTWAHYSTTYPWARDVNHNNSAEELLLWTPTNTNPSTYYTSIKQVSANSADLDWSGVVEFQDIENLTMDYLKFEGGEFRTVSFIKCDTATITNNVFDKPQYGSVALLQCSNFSFTNNDFYGFDTLPSGTIIYDETAGRDGLSIFYDSDNNIVRGNNFYNYSTQSINVSSATSLYQSNAGYGTGIPENNIIDSNYIANTLGRRYSRPFQVHANEMTDASLSTLNDNTRQPVNTIITRNMIKGMNVGAKDIGNGIIFMYNVYEGQNTTLPTWIIDHNGIMASNNSYVFETLGDTTHALRLYANNTFLNVQSGISYSGSDLGFTTANIAYENNLFLNMARSRKFNIRTFTPNIYINSDVDFKWYRNRVALSVQNNLSYNSNLTDSGDRLTYKIDESASNTFTYAEFATYLTGDANRVVSGNIPLSNASFNLNSILPNWQNGDYNVSESSAAYNGGKSISSYIPSWLTKDYFGNEINTTNPNIGAVNN